MGSREGIPGRAKQELKISSGNNLASHKDRKEIRLAEITGLWEEILHEWDEVMVRL